MLKKNTLKLYLLFITLTVLLTLPVTGFGSNEDVSVVNLSYIAPGYLDIGTVVADFDEDYQQYYYTVDALMLSTLRSLVSDYNMDSTFSGAADFTSVPWFGGRIGALWGSDDFSVGVGFPWGYDFFKKDGEDYALGYYGVEIPVKYKPINEVTLLCLPYYEIISASQSGNADPIKGTRVGIDVLPFYQIYDPLSINALIGFNYTSFEDETSGMSTRFVLSIGWDFAN